MTAGATEAGRFGEAAIEFFVITALLILVVGLILTMLRFGRNDFQDLALVMAGRERKAFEVLKPCPLCSSMLRKGQTVKSKVIEILPANSHQTKTRYAGNQMGIKETIAHVFGCQYCWPGNPEHPRICPFCKTKLGFTDYVIARYFEKTQGKNHLHVLGCTKCRRK